MATQTPWTNPPTAVVSPYEVITGNDNDLYLDLFRQQTIASDVTAQLDALAFVIAQIADPNLLIQAGITPQTGQAVSHRKMASQLIQHFGADRLVAALT